MPDLTYFTAWAAADDLDALEAGYDRITPAYAFYKDVYKGKAAADEADIGICNAVYNIAQATYGRALSPALTDAQVQMIKKAVCLEADERFPRIGLTDLQACTVGDVSLTMKDNRQQQAGLYSRDAYAILSSLGLLCRILL